MIWLQRLHNPLYLKDMHRKYCNYTILRDKGYLSAEVQQNLFHVANITLEIPYRRIKRIGNLLRGLQMFILQSEP